MTMPRLRNAVVIVALGITWAHTSLDCQTEGKIEKQVDVEYLPPLPSDLIKKERQHERDQQLDSIRQILTQAKKGKKRDKRRAPKAPRGLVMRQAVAQQTAVDQEVFNLLNQQYDDPVLQQKAVSLQLKAMPVKEVLRIISKATEVPFMIDADVQGQVQELAVHNVPLAVVLRSVLASSQPRLAALKEHGVWRIMRYEAAKEQMKGLATKEREKDVVSAVVALTNIKWTPGLKQRVEKLWQGIVQASPEKPFFYMVMDEANSKVFFKARKAYAEEFAKHLRELDVKVPEVRIDIRVVSADKNFEESLGFNWSGVYNRRASVKRNDFVGLGAATTDGTAPDKNTDYRNLIGWAFNLVPDTAQKLVKLPFVFGNNDMNTKRLTLELDAAETRKEIRTILKPSLLVHNQESAEILVGSELPLQVRLDETVEGQLTNVTTVRYKDIGTKVKVVPAVQPNQDDIFLDIFVENSQIAYLNSDQLIGNGSPNGGFNYTIETSRSQNRVLLRSGETTMIGGLITSQKIDEKNGVPLLQDIPVVRWLFSWSHKKVVDKQLLIFITPTLKMA